MASSHLHSSNRQKLTHKVKTLNSRHTPRPQNQAACCQTEQARLAVHIYNKWLFMRPSKSLLSSIAPTFEPDLQDTLSCVCFPCEFSSDGWGRSNANFCLSSIRLARCTTFELTWTLCPDVHMVCIFAFVASFLMYRVWVLPGAFLRMTRELPFCF